MEDGQQQVLAEWQLVRPLPSNESDGSNSASSVVGARTSNSRWSALEVTGFASAVAFLLFDVGWILEKPWLFLLGGLPGIVLQTLCAWMSFRHHRGFEVTMQFGFVLWIVANFVWGSSEFLWSADWPMTHDLDRSYESPIIVVGTVMVFFSALVLLHGHLVVLYQGRRLQTRAADAAIADASRCEAGVASLVAYDGASSQDKEDRLSQRHAYLFFFAMSDAVWCLGNCLQVNHVHSAGVLILLACLIVAWGLPSVVLGLQTVRGDLRCRMRADAAMLLADVLWVSANVLWAFEDILSTVLSSAIVNLLANISLALFGLCGIFMALSLVMTNEDGEHIHLAGAMSISRTPSCARDLVATTPSVDDKRSLMASPPLLACSGEGAVMSPGEP